MKKFAVIFLLSLGISFSLAAQSSAGAANKNTALRCLKLAENCLVADDWQNALNQAELGLSYDDSISDLYYIKAAASLNLGATKADALRLLSSAFERSSWAGYTKNSARIFIADLLSDTGLYEESLSALDSEPYIYSADAEFIRIKNYYRMGTTESLANARQRLNSDRRVYPSDQRFPEIFFMFESLFMSEAERDGIDYKIPQIVSTIADSYITKLPDYSDRNPELELMAVSFARGEDKLRLIKAIDAKNKKLSELLATAALRAGIYTDAEAFDMYFGASGNEFSLDSLETFIALLSDPEVVQRAAETLADFTGTLYIDENMDLQYEFVVQYENGRPQYIKYDANNDGLTELYSSCDFGAPVFVYFNSSRIQFFYDTYPRISKVLYSDTKLNFNFLHDDFTFSPFDFVTDNVIARTGAEFYIPYITETYAIPLPQDLIEKASSFELPITERDDAKIVYTLSGGNIVFAEFYENNARYAYCDFSKESSLVRFVDYDNDGSFETTELYSEIPFAQEGLRSEENDRIISSVFNFIDGRSDLYLRKIQIDRNANTFCEFSEQYLEFGGKVTIWDNDDNGIPDSQYIRYPQKEGETLIEESIYFDSNGLQILSLTLANGVPVKMIADAEGTEVMVYAGENENIYWIDEKGLPDEEQAILNYVSHGLEQGRIDIFDYKEEERISVIKVGAAYYCRRVPLTSVPLDEEGASK
ncbi:hypothetical protein SAMN04487775_10396 [Treponema bryantii]|uniref:Uncharacterized protein n=1 Tax=Treponema bryantii TaxID=163 RepID=A0A1I3JKQ9_9SPIR|nr:hypothetical protein [Treponema bryantii]SFI60852.1 hypothetical protein SAMN04487775_10396 [Treponema bryantii]